MMDIIDLTCELVRFKTMHSKPDEIRRCAAYIEQYLKRLGVSCNRFGYGNSPAVLALPQSKKTPVLLMSHMDVVDAPERFFSPVIQDGKLYGRGCFDDKYAVALSLILFKNHLQRLRKQGRGQQDLPFGILMTGDEEIGGFNGAKKILREIEADFCIVLDGGGIEKIVVKEKGVVSVTLFTCIKPDSGDARRFERNALEILKRDIDKWAVYFVKSAPEHRHRKIICRSIQPLTYHQGIPDTAQAQLEIWYTRTDDVERMFSSMQGDLHSKITIDHVEPIFDGESPEHLKWLLDISKKTRIGFEDGANDSQFLSRFGIKGVVWGADGDRSQHTLDEHVSIESIYELYGLLDNFIKRCESKARMCQDGEKEKNETDILECKRHSSRCSKGFF
ncbi:MAG: M20 family metallopeptidase [Desulfobacterales bacterium]|jgi:succinyl-diaminopimelate desuccinylase|nr:M20 family metallopeptidase [Desulfobacterales bacterium]